MLGSLSLMILDPLTIMIRTLTEAIYPALDRIVIAVEEALYSVSALRGAVSALDRTLRPALLPADPAFTAGGVLIAAFFVGIIALNALAPRFWCRYLCPLGSLLGLTSKIAVFRREVNPRRLQRLRRLRARLPDRHDPPGKGRRQRSGRVHDVPGMRFRLPARRAILPGPREARALEFV